MKNHITEILYSAIIGDASGYPLDGLKKTHIQAVFKDAKGYLDPSPALKNNMDKWKKAGLYSSITQFIILITASIDNRTFNKNRFIEAVLNSPELPDTQFSYFREPGSAERNLISAAESIKEGNAVIYTKSCARIMPLTLPLLLIDDHSVLLQNIIKIVSLFTTDVTTAAYSYFFLQLISDILKTDDDNLLKTAKDSAENSLTVYNESQHLLFSSGYNPDYFITEAERYISLLEILTKAADIDNAEQIISNNANSRLKSPITRASVNLPECLLPFAIYLSAKVDDCETIFHTASRVGGSASAFAAISGALTCAFKGNCIPAYLSENLANKKKISTILEIISKKSDRSELIKILMESEPGLTLKEADEFKARNKNEIKTSKSQKTRKDVESELTRHVVESWTKIDKAKWRKERNHKDT